MYQHHVESKWWLNNKNLGSKKFVFVMVLGSSFVVAHMMATGGLHNH
jgi:hypothetical protein